MGPLFAKRRAAIRRAWSASSSAIRSSCRKWQSAFRTPAPTLPSPYSSTNALTECTSRTTGWLVSWLLTEIQQPQQSRGTSTRKWKASCTRRQVELATVGGTECQAAGSQEILKTVYVTLLSRAQVL